MTLEINTIYIYMHINVHGYIIIDGIGRHFWI